MEVDGGVLLFLVECVCTSCATRRYLDDDLMVVRDESGIPEILVRKPKEFLVESTGEPSYADDDLAPGAG